jgi:hypothetical protein
MSAVVPLVGPLLLALLVVRGWQLVQVLTR